MDNAQLIAQAEMSPCVGVCKMDEVSGWCFGCGRTDDEIANWQVYDSSSRKVLHASLSDRVEQLIVRRRAQRNLGKRGNKRANRRPAVVVVDL
ncbi:MAG: DUF1289 domain-containing protein [Oceanospirillaceae bacterium]|nr:DUF1289 domain-containing protein [Oceanospirillaceae bacterium]